MELSRRRFLRAVLGAPAALAACRRGPRTYPFTGRLLGQDLGRGHFLRDGHRPEPDRVEKTSVVIIGAGIAGLSAAWQLDRHGHGNFVVLELEDHPGGTSASGENAISAFPYGAHYVPVPIDNQGSLVDLLQELGVVEGVDDHGKLTIAEEVLCRAPQERIFFAGRFHDGLYPRYGASREDLRQQRAFEAEIARWVGMQSGRRAFALPSVLGASTPEIEALDRISMADWLNQRGLTSPRLRWWIEYACRDDYGATLADTSAYAGVFYFASRVATPGERAAEFMTWPEGNGRLVRHLAARAGARLRTGIVVTDVRPAPGGALVSAFDTARRKAIGYQASHVVVAVPRYVARHLVAPYRENPPPHLAAFTYSPWLVANLTLKTRPKEKAFPLAWDNVIYDSKSLGYVVATHQAGKDYGPTVWSYYLPLLDQEASAYRSHLLSAPWETWADVVLTDLERVHPKLRDHVETIDIFRWGHAMVRPKVGLLRGGALTEARRPLGQIRFANTDLSGMALFEEAHHWGVVAADEILGLEKRG